MMFRRMICTRPEEYEGVTLPAASAMFSADELRLVDVVIRLHDLAHHGDPTREIGDQERGDMITLALLHVGRSLCGWNHEALLDLARQAGRLGEPGALEELAAAVRSHLHRPRTTPGESGS